MIKLFHVDLKGNLHIYVEVGGIVYYILIQKMGGMI